MSHVYHMAPGERTVTFIQYGPTFSSEIRDPTKYEKKVIVREHDEKMSVGTIWDEDYVIYWHDIGESVS